MPEVRCRAHEVKKPIFGTAFLGGGMNGESVGLDPEKRILGWPSAWLIGTRLIIEFSSPESGWGWCLKCPAGLTRCRNPFLAQFRGGGGMDELKLCRSGPWKRHFGIAQRLVDENQADD